MGCCDIWKPLMAQYPSSPLVNAVSVHDCQLVDDIPIEKILIHDVPVDITCPPTRVIFANTTIPKPQAGQIRILRVLKSRIERESDQNFLVVRRGNYPPMS